MVTPEEKKLRQREYYSIYVEKNRLKFTLSDAKRRADKIGVPFNLTVDTLPEIPEFCPILGIELRRSMKGVRGPSNNSPSLDRIVPSKGYVEGNVRFISMRANRLKNDASLEELKSLVKYLEESLV